MPPEFLYIKFIFLNKITKKILATKGDKKKLKKNPIHLRIFPDFVAKKS